MRTGQNCLLCAWRENCAKRFSVSDGGARCPDFSSDVSISVLPDVNDNSSDCMEYAK